MDETAKKNLVQKLVSKLSRKAKNQFEASFNENINNFVSRFVDYEEMKNCPIPIKTDVEKEFASCNYEDLLNKLNCYDHSYDIKGPIGIDIIDNVEAESGYTFPPTFKEYLRVFGGMSCGDAMTVGFGSNCTLDELFANTRYCQEHHDLPEGFICLEYDFERSYITCMELGLAAGDDTPVLWYLLDSQKFDGIHSKNFDVFIRNDIGSIICCERKQS